MYGVRNGTIPHIPDEKNGILAPAVMSSLYGHDIKPNLSGARKLKKSYGSISAGPLR